MKYACNVCFKRYVDPRDATLCCIDIDKHDEPPIDIGDDFVVKDRGCGHCQGTYTGTEYGLCSNCGKFQ